MPGRLVPFLISHVLLVLLAAACAAVQIDDLSRRPDAFGPYTFRVFPDGTLLVSGVSGPRRRGYKRLRLNKIVSIPSPPPDGKLAGTLLLARVYPNSTVIWASVITTLLVSDIRIAIDSRNNVYAVGPPHDELGGPLEAVHAIKYDKNGNRVYETVHVPPPRDPTKEFSLALYDAEDSRFSRLGPDGDGLAFIPPRTLVTGGLLYKSPYDNSGSGIPAFLSFRAKNGKFRRVQGDRSPPGDSADSVSDTSNLAVTKTKRGPLACYMFNGGTSGERLKKVYARCTLLRKGPLVRDSSTRELETFIVNEVSVFFERVVLEENSPKSRPPSLFVVYGRIDDNENEVVIRRLDGETLEDVDWGTGEKTADARPIRIVVPKPIPDDGSRRSTSHRDLLYSRTTGSVVLFLTSIVPIVDFIPEPTDGGKITAVEDPDQGPDGPGQFFRQEWLLIFDKNRQLTPQLLEPENGFYPSAVAFRPDGKCFYTYGLASDSQLGFAFRPIPNALTCRQGGCC